jgi:hypothetical protein
MNNNADTFDQWVVKRSFEMVAPICKLTLLILLPMLLVVDPVFFVKGFWTANPQYFYLTLWHVVLAIGFLGILIATKFTNSHAARARVLVVFLVFSALIFSWFGIISWFITGDFSTYGIVMICMAAMFSFPGPLRRFLYVGTAVGMSIIISSMDEKGTFLGSAVFINFGVIVAVSLAVDRYMMKNSRSHFNDICGIAQTKPNPLAES